MTNYTQFHDGFFEGLWIPEKAVVHIFVSTLKKERAVFVLTGVVMVKVTGLKEGNIVLDISTRDHDEIAMLDIAELYELDPEHKPESWEQKLLEKARNESYQIFELNPSYGGSCLVLAHNTELISRTRWAECYRDA
jgi:hypothetical protein